MLYGYVEPTFCIYIYIYIYITNCNFSFMCYCQMWSRNKYAHQIQIGHIYDAMMKPKGIPLLGKGLSHFMPLPSFCAILLHQGSNVPSLSSHCMYCLPHFLLPSLGNQEVVLSIHLPLVCLMTCFAHLHFALLLSAMTSFTLVCCLIHKFVFLSFRLTLSTFLSICHCAVCRWAAWVFVRDHVSVA